MSGWGIVQSAAVAYAATTMAAAMMAVLYDVRPLSLSTVLSVVSLLLSGLRLASRIFTKSMSLWSLPPSGFSTAISPFNDVVLYPCVWYE
jgi:hypothetical protein